ncbi:MAG: hypothetical protein ACYC6G_11020 [Desulfobaccales bacterium]
MFEPLASMFQSFTLPRKSVILYPCASSLQCGAAVLQPLATPHLGLHGRRGHKRCGQYG